MNADATLPGGMGTFGWDDDGVPGMRTKLIDKGIFVGYLTSRETAGALGVPVAIGSARAEGWQHFPIVRMVNVSLDPGTARYADLVRGVDSGLLLEAPASYSLDDKRQNFHFPTQSARVIRNGQLAGHVRGVAFQTLTPDFWGRCDLAADDWQLHGLLSCAKGEPLQLMRVGHGAAPARFPAVPIATPTAYDEATAKADAAAQAGDIDRMCAAVPRGMRAAGTQEIELTEDAVANTRGVAAYAPSTMAYVRALVLGERSGSGYAEDLAWRASALEPEAVAERATKKAALDTNRMQLPPGDYEAVFEEVAVAEILRIVSITCLGGEQGRQGRSFTSGRAREKEHVDPLP